MKRSEINQPTCYFDKYISCIADIELSEAFAQSHRDLDFLDVSQLNQLGDRVYAEGKWTIKDILQHLIDTERILAYRALRIGRNDKTILPGFDQEVLAANVSTAGRKLEELIQELKLVRNTTQLLYNSFDRDALMRFIVTDVGQMSTLAYGFTILGHQQFHFDSIRTRYLPLLS